MIVAPIKKFCFSSCFYLESIKLITEIPISSVHGICRAIQFTNKFVMERTDEKIRSHPRPQPMSSNKQVSYGHFY